MGRPQIRENPQYIENISWTTSPYTSEEYWVTISPWTSAGPLVHGDYGVDHKSLGIRNIGTTSPYTLVES